MAQGWPHPTRLMTGDEDLGEDVQNCSESSQNGVVSVHGEGGCCEGGSWPYIFYHNEAFKL